jgi:predicted acetyltransferase/ADP-ribose pyrophosphatase YjhB (NUDIX family)
LTGCQEYLADKTSVQMIEPVSEMIDTLQKDSNSFFYNVYKQECGIDLKSDHVLTTTFWLVEDNKYIGTFALRHNLTENLKISGGHIVYQIIPSKLRQGYATKGLFLCLAEALKLGLEEVLITCHEDNIASYKTMNKVMLKMGGREIEPSETDGYKNRRVWIKTKERHDGKIRPLALAIITKGNKILANKGYDNKKQEWFYRLPGGGIDFYEKAEDTIKRELKEENGIDVFVGKKLGVIENVFEFNGKKGHEIAIIFQAKLSDEDMAKDKIPLVEPEFEGCFSEFIEINSENKIYPQEALQFIDSNVISSNQGSLE